MASLRDETVQTLYDRAASTEPTPGGGSVTALSGMLGIALILKALRISLRRDEDRAAHAACETELAALADSLAGSADEDARAFQAYIDAARLPKASEEERGVRARALVHAAVEAAEAALRTLAHARRAYALSREIEPAIRPSIVADLVAGRELLKVVRAVAAENVEANLRGLRDDAERDRLARALALDGDPAAFA